MRAEESWISIPEYARCHQISDMTVRRRIKTGQLDAVLRQGKYMIRASAGHVDAGEANVLAPFERPPVLTRTPKMELSAFLPKAEVSHEALNKVMARLEQLGQDVTQTIAKANAEASVAKLLAKDLEIHQLKQKVEDLESLIAILESR